jgi:hypothetical protein
MIQLLNNLLLVALEYLRLKNKTTLYTQIDAYENEKYELISKLESLRDAGSSSDTCKLLRNRIVSLNERLEYLSAHLAETSTGSDDSDGGGEVHSAD